MESPTAALPRRPLAKTLAHALLIAGALGLFALTAVLESPFEEHDLYGRAMSLEAPDFSLRDTEGRSVSMTDFRGRFVYLMFGYLSCDQVCHAQSLTFYMLSRRISDERVQFLFVDMDPAKDTPEKIRQYFDARAANFKGLLARDMAQAQAIAASYHAYFSTEPATDSASYRINHPGWIYLIDPGGEIRAIYNGVDLDVERMLGDLEILYSDYHGH